MVIIKKKLEFIINKPILGKANNMTVLIFAAVVCGEVNIVQELISKLGADVNGKERLFGDTALMCVFKARAYESWHSDDRNQKYIDMMLLLLDNGADPYLEDCQGTSVAKEIKQRVNLFGDSSVYCGISDKINDILARKQLATNQVLLFGQYTSVKKDENGQAKRVPKLSKDIRTYIKHFI